MRIRLVSNDRHLHKLCRETLAKLPHKRWDFAATGPSQESTPADLYIWDFDPQTPLPPDRYATLEPSNIFVVGRKHLRAFYERLLMSNVDVVLKPVNPVAFQTFLENAIVRYETRRARLDTGHRDGTQDDRDLMLQCLLQANLKLQEYDQDRTNFLARGLHDFRTPLTAISGYCGLLLGRHLGSLNRDQIDVLQRMQHSVKRLSRLVTAMFQLSVGRQLSREPRVQPADIQVCVDQALHEISPSIDEKGIAISMQLQNSEQVLLFEPTQIEQVLINLLDNACKFTPKHGTIEVRGYPVFWERRAVQVNWHGEERRASHSEEANGFRIDIHDSGLGIPPEHLDRVFEEYTSFSGGQDRSGSGLGLAICRMIVNAHQGRIWADSDTDGATFSFVLPILQERPPLVLSSGGAGSVTQASPLIERGGH